MNRGNRPINRAAIEALELGPTDRVIEVGFGGGVALNELLRRTDGGVVGIETSQAMLKRARWRFRRALRAGRLELADADVARLPHADESFDRALAVQTIYFWPNVEGGLRELRRVLRAGGRLVLATAPKEVMDRREFTQHGFRKFTEDELGDLMSGAGFERVGVRRRGAQVITTGTRAEP